MFFVRNFPSMASENINKAYVMELFCPQAREKNASIVQWLFTDLISRDTQSERWLSSDGFLKWGAKSPKSLTAMKVYKCRFRNRDHADSMLTSHQCKRETWILNHTSGFFSGNRNVLLQNLAFFFIPSGFHPAHFAGPPPSNAFFTPTTSLPLG